MICFLYRGLGLGVLLVIPGALLLAELVITPNPSAFPKNSAVGSQIAALGIVDPDTGLEEHQAVIGMAAGSTHSLLVKEDGSLWATGNNLSGQLADGSSGGDFWGFDVGVDRNVPIQILESGVQAVSAGEEHSLVLMGDGSLWGAGGNLYGQLGDGTEDSRPSLKQIVDSGVVACSAGPLHSLFIKSDGSLWGMGLNEWGAIGDGSGEGGNVVHLEPFLVVGEGVVACAAGGEHSLFVKSDGSLWAMGANTFGQLGDDTGLDQYSPVQILSSGVSAVAAGVNHSLFIKSDGSLWAMGDNFSGQLGDKTDEDRFIPVKVIRSGVVEVAAGDSYSIYLKSDGSVWSMGSAELGRLGNGEPSSDQWAPVKSVSSGVAKVSAGQDHWLALMEDGTLLGTGQNYHGQLGISISGGQPNHFDTGIDVDSPEWVSGAQYSFSVGEFEDDRQFFTLSGNRLHLEAPVNLLGRSGFNVQIQAQTPDGLAVDQAVVVNVDSENFSYSNPSAVPLQPNGWVALDWFGTYFSHSATWIYHQVLGWLYLANDPAGEGYWLWSTDLGWLWIAPANYPWSFRHGHGWVYLTGDTTVRVYYDATAGEWVVW